MADIQGAPSPDGRYLSFTHWETANLAVYDLTTGEKRDLTDEGTWMEPDQWADWSTWSPDGERIAYAWFNKDQEELRIIGIDGSEPRVLYRDEEVKFIRPHTWSRDGKSILAWFKKENGPNEMVLISVEHGSVRVLKSPAPASIKMSLSPDGRYVVYGVPGKEYVGQGDIFLLATDGSREVRLVEHPANDYGPIWAPDEKTVVFASDRAGTVGVWLTQIVDGKPTGVVDRVKRDMGRILPMGFTRSGALYYGLGAGLNDVYVASLDPATGKVLEPPVKATQRFEGFNRAPAWSRDGRRLAYVSNRSQAPGGIGENVRSLVIRDLETGEEREFSPEGVNLYHLRWSPDGRSILSGYSYGVYTSNLHLIEVQTGDVTLILHGDSESPISQAVWSPDGKRIFYLRSHLTETAYIESIVAHTLETGEEVVLHRGGGNRGLAVSPDGRQLAFPDTSGQALWVMPTEGGEPSEVHRLKESEDKKISWRVLEWTPDGRYLLFGKTKWAPDQPDAPEDDPIELWRIPAGGGEPQKLLAAEGHNDIRVHPDGRRIAYTGGLANRTEVWVMENFLPEKKQKSGVRGQESE